MNIFDELGKIYNEIDNKYASIEVQARLRGHHKKEAEYSRKRQLNDQAYFLFMFTRFEGRVRDISDSLINSKVTNLVDWKINRAWDIINSRYAKVRNYIVNRSEASIKCLFFTKLPLRITNSA